MYTLNKIYFISFVFIINFILSLAIPTISLAQNSDNGGLKQIIKGLQPPEDESSDIAAIKKIVSERTPEDCEKAFHDSFFSSLMFYGPPRHPFFSKKEFNIVSKFLDVMTYKVDQVVHILKRQNMRLRPFERSEHPEIFICKDRQGQTYSTRAIGTSYPSGHSAAAYLQGLLLSELFPSLKDKIMARAEEIGRNRMVLAVHFPSDVKAGFEIAKRAVDFFKTQDDFKKLLKDLRMEITTLKFKSDSTSKDMSCDLQD